MATSHQKRVTSVLMLAHVAGMVDLVALPLWIGALVQHYRLDFEHAGLTVTLFLVGVVGASLTLAPRFDRLPRRFCAIAGYALSAGALILAAGTSSWTTLLLLHLIAGVGTGCGLSMVHGAMGRVDNPHRLFAWAGAALGVFSVAFYALVPQIMAVAGSPSLFLIMGGLMVCAAIAAFAFPSETALMPVPGHVQEHGPIPRKVWFMVIGIVCLALNQAIIFSFLERIGVVRGFGVDRVNAVLAAVGIVNLFPAALAGFLQHRLPPLRVAIVAALLQAGLALTISSATDFAPYAVAASVYVFVIIFAHTFLFGLGARLDPSGRTTALTPAMLMVGSAIGPALAGTVAQRLGFAGLGLAVTGFAAISIACFALLGRHVHRTVGRPEGPPVSVVATD